MCVQRSVNTEDGVSLCTCQWRVLEINPIVLLVGNIFNFFFVVNR